MAGPGTEQKETVFIHAISMILSVFSVIRFMGFINPISRYFGVIPIFMINVERGWSIFHILNKERRWRS